MLFIVKKDMPKESVKRNHVVQIFKETDFRVLAQGGQYDEDQWI